VPLLPPSIQFSRSEYAYLAWHVGWRDSLPGVTGGDLIYKRVGVDEQESQLISGNYRPEAENTAAGAGPDIGIEMWNTKLSRLTQLHDPYIVFHPIDALKEALAQAFAEPLKPFARWSYPGRKTDSTINLAAVKLEVGEPSTIYDIGRSPYWKMKAAGMETRDLPVPPADVWVSTLPVAPLRYNTGGNPPNPTGIEINKLQRVLRDLGRFTGTLDHWYGPRVRDGVASIQRDFASSGLWTGPLDGKEYSTALRSVWDGVLEANFYLARGSI